MIQRKPTRNILIRLCDKFSERSVHREMLGFGFLAIARSNREVPRETFGWSGRADQRNIRRSSSDRVRDSSRDRRERRSQRRNESRNYNFGLDIIAGVLLMIE